MRAMVLAAGLGTRLRPLTDVLPKPLVAVVDRPLLAHTLDLLQRHGIDRALANLHHLPEAIEESFAHRLELRREPQLRGTAGSVRDATDFFGDQAGLVVYGDTLTDVDIGRLVERHRASGGVLTFAAKRVSDVRGLGVVLADADGRVQGFQEKPDPAEALSDLANCGVLCFEPEVFEHFPDRQPLDWALDVFPALLSHDVPFHAHEIDGYYNDMGSFEALRRGTWDLLEGRVRLPLRQSADHPAHAEGAVWVGEGCEIGRDVALTGPVVVGDGCRIGTGARLSETILLPGAQVAPGEVVVGAIKARRR